MSPRLALSRRLESLLEGIRPRAWRSGWTGEMFGPQTVRVVAVDRSDLPEVREVASRILGPVYPAYRGHEGTVYGRVATLAEDTGFRLVSSLHDGCLTCYGYISPAITHAAVTGSVGATYGDQRLGEGGERIEHHVTVRRVGL